MSSTRETRSAPPPPPPPPPTVSDGSEPDRNGAPMDPLDHTTRPVEPSASAPQPAGTGGRAGELGAVTGIRASDAEREEVVARLHQALGEGRLDLSETERRVATAYGTTYRDELPRLLTDLPSCSGWSRSAAVSSSQGPGSWSQLWTSLVWRARVAIWDDRAAGAPTSAQLRIAGLAVGLAVLWTVLCAILAAVAVAS